MARLQDVVIDCRYPAALARFWAAALDGYTVAPYDDEELARLRSIGIDDPEDDPTVLVESPGGQPRLWFQRVFEERTVKNRLHLDLQADDAEAEVRRMVLLGAQVAPEQHDDAIVVMSDPEGNEFCIVS